MGDALLFNTVSAATWEGVSRRDAPEPSSLFRSPWARPQNLPWSPQLPPAYMRSLESLRPLWQFSLSPNGLLLAIVKDSAIEVRPMCAGTTGHASARVEADTWSKWRQLAWSTDSKYIVLSSSGGTVRVLRADDLGLVCTLSRSTDLRVHPTLVNPLAAIEMRAPAMPSFNGHKYSHELLLLDYDGTLRSFMLNAADLAALNQGNPPSPRSQFAFSDTGAVDGLCRRFFRVSFSRHFRYTMCISMRDDGETLLVGGVGCDGQPAWRAWATLPEFPHFRRLDAPNKADNVNLEDVPEQTSRGWFGSLSLRSAPSEPLSTYLTSMHFSPDGTRFAAADTAGHVVVVPTARMSEPISLAAESSAVCGVWWWSDTDLALVCHSGLVKMVGIDSPALPERLNTQFAEAPLLLGRRAGAAPAMLILDHQERRLHILWRGTHQMTLARAEHVNEGEYGDDEEDGEEAGENADTALQRILSTLVRPLTVVTEYLLWTFDDDKFVQRKRIRASKSTYRLLALEQTTPRELVDAKVAGGHFADALAVARTHNLPTNSIYAAQWETVPMSLMSIQDILVNITDPLLVIKLCLENVPETVEVARALLDHALKQTDVVKKAHAGAYIDRASLSELELQLCRHRLAILDLQDRLASTVALLAKDGDGEQGEYSFRWTFESIRNCDLVAFAADLAAQRSIEAVHLLYVRHTAQLAPYRLAILQLIPEVVSPRDYAALLPRWENDTEAWVAPEPWREPDWLEGQPWLADIAPVTERTHVLSSQSLPAPREVLARWFRHRAVEIDAVAGQTDFAVDLARLAVDNGFTELERTVRDFSLFASVLMDVGPVAESVLDLSFAEFDASPTNRRLDLLRNGADADIFAMRLARHAPDLFHDAPASTIADYLVEQCAKSEEGLRLAIAVARESDPISDPSHRVVPEEDDLVDLILRCIAAGVKFDTELHLSLAALIPESAQQGSRADDVKLLLARVHCLKGMARFGVSSTLAELVAMHNNADAQQRFFVRLIRRVSSSERDYRKLLSFIEATREQLCPSIRLSFIHRQFVITLMTDARMFGAAHELLSDQKRDPSWKPLEIDDREELVLSAADEFFDNADGCEPDNPLLNAASSCLLVLSPQTPRTTAKLRLIEACRLLFRLRHGSNVAEEADEVMSPDSTAAPKRLLPIQVGHSRDRVALVEEALAMRPVLCVHADDVWRLAGLLLGAADDAPVTALAAAPRLRISAALIRAAVASNHLAAAVTLVRALQVPRAADNQTPAAVLKVVSEACLAVADAPGKLGHAGRVLAARHAAAFAAGVDREAGARALARFAALECAEVADETRPADAQTPLSPAALAQETQPLDWTRPWPAVTVHYLAQQRAAALASSKELLFDEPSEHSAACGALLPVDTHGALGLVLAASEPGLLANLFGGSSSQLFSAHLGLYVYGLDALASLDAAGDERFGISASLRSVAQVEEAVELMSKLGTMALAEPARESAGLAIAFRERSIEGRMDAEVQRLLQGTKVEKSRWRIDVSYRQACVRELASTADADQFERAVALAGPARLTAKQVCAANIAHLMALDGPAFPVALAAISEERRIELMEETDERKIPTTSSLGFQWLTGRWWPFVVHSYAADASPSADLSTLKATLPLLSPSDTVQVLESTLLQSSPSPWSVPAKVRRDIVAAAEAALDGCEWDDVQDRLDTARRFIDVVLEVHAANISERWQRKAEQSLGSEEKLVTLCQRLALDTDYEWPSLLHMCDILQRAYGGAMFSREAVVGATAELLVRSAVAGTTSVVVAGNVSLGSPWTGIATLSRHVIRSEDPLGDNATSCERALLDPLRSRIVDASVAPGVRLRLMENLHASLPRAAQEALLPHRVVALIKQKWPQSSVAAADVSARPSEMLVGLLESLDPDVAENDTRILIVAMLAMLLRPHADAAWPYILKFLLRAPTPTVRDFVLSLRASLPSSALSPDDEDELSELLAERAAADAETDPHSACRHIVFLLLCGHASDAVAGQLQQLASNDHVQGCAALHAAICAKGLLHVVQGTPLFAACEAMLASPDVEYRTLLSNMALASLVARGGATLHAARLFARLMGVHPAAHSIDALMGLLRGYLARAREAAGKLATGGHAPPSLSRTMWDLYAADVGGAVFDAMVDVSAFVEHGIAPSAVVAACDDARAALAPFFN